MTKTLIAALMIAVVVLAGFTIYGEIQWHKWVSTHCTEIGTISDSIGAGPMVGSNGVVGVGISYIPGKTGYKCGDGEEYWR